MSAETLVTNVSIVLGALIMVCVIIISPLILRDTIRQRGKWGLPLHFKRPACTQCGTPLPQMFRMPTSLRQALWGGWTCAECGFELDRWGRPTEEQNKLSKWAVLRAAEEADEREHRRQHPDERIHNVNDQTQRGDAS